jgi:hypothetical protein
VVGGWLILAACAGGSRILSYGDDTASGQSDGSPRLIGEWETTLGVTAGGDLQTWTTNWRFEASGTCRFRQTIRSVLSGTRVKLRHCTWSTANGAARITFSDTGLLLEIPYSFPGGDTSRMIFEGLTYQRIG